MVFFLIKYIDRYIYKEHLITMQIAGPHRVRFIVPLSRDFSIPVPGHYSSYSMYKILIY
jgi:hypothetical protein